jgi:hypothetical protein
MQIYQFANQEKQQEEAQTQWLNQFNEQIRQYDSSLTEQARQYNESLTEQKRATDLGNKYNYDQLAEDTRQFDTQLAESTRQFEAQQAESTRQFNASLTEQQRQALIVNNQIVQSLRSIGGQRDARIGTVDGGEVAHAATAVG